MKGGGEGWYEMVERGRGVAGNHGGRKGMVGREGGGQGMVGIEGGEGVHAYLVEYKMTTTLSSSSLSSLVSLLRLVAPLPNVTWSHALLGHSWFWGLGRACRSHLWPLVVIRGSSLLGIRCHPFGVHLLGAGRRLLVARLSRCWGGCCRLGSWGC